MRAQRSSHTYQWNTSHSYQLRKELEEEGGGYLWRLASFLMSSYTHKKLVIFFSPLKKCPLFLKLPLVQALQQVNSSPCLLDMKRCSGALQETLHNKRIQQERIHSAWQYYCSIYAGMFLKKNSRMCFNFTWFSGWQIHNFMLPSKSKCASDKTQFWPRWSLMRADGYANTKLHIQM